jgi:hypothetical protein
MMIRNKKNKKWCPKCEQWKPRTTEFFFLGRGNKGFASYCKPCHSRVGIQNRKRDPFNSEKQRIYDKRHRQKKLRVEPNYYNEIAHKSAQRLRQQVVDAYGGRCSCCGEDRLPFLTLEHMNGDGKAHRARLGTGGGAKVWRDLKRRGWPQEGYEILCWNCHLATARGAICPHKLRNNRTDVVLNPD